MKISPKTSLWEVVKPQYRNSFSIHMSAVLVPFINKQVGEISMDNYWKVGENGLQTNKND